MRQLDPLQWGESSGAFEGADEMGQPFLFRCDAIGLQIHHPEDAAPELGHVIVIWHMVL